MAQASSPTATRVAYGKRLAELGVTHPEIVVLDADLSQSTQTHLFAKKFPERFFNVGVAEQDLMGTAAGLAHSGHTVFASTFAMFAAGRAWEIVRQSIAYPHLNVKVCPSHAGITVGEDGASHQIIEDLALMRVIPGMTVLVPADQWQARAMVDYLAKTHKGPAYLRLCRAAANDVFDESYTFDPLKGHVLTEGKDVCVFATGYVTRAVVDAAELLRADGRAITVVNLPSVKPIDANLIVRMAKSHRVLVSAEEHSTVAGFGSAISEVLAEFHPQKLVRLGLQDEFGQSGTHTELLKHYGLDSDGIAQKIRTIL